MPHRCIPADMHEDGYVIVDPACEVNERGARDKNDRNETVVDYDLQLDLELTEQTKMNDETLTYTEKHWNHLRQTEIDKGVENSFPLTMEMRHGKRGGDKKEYNPLSEDFVVDTIVLDDVTDSVVGLDKIVVS